MQSIHYLVIFMQLVHYLVIVGIILIVLLAIVLFRVNTHIQMKVSFNMDDECDIYNTNGLVIFIKKHKRKLTNPTLVVVDITNLNVIYKLLDNPKDLMVKLSDFMLKGLKSEETLARLAFNKFIILYNGRKKEEIAEQLRAFEESINSVDFIYNVDIQYRILYGVYEAPTFQDSILDIKYAEASIRFSKLKDKNFYYFSPDVTAVLAKRDTIGIAKKAAYDEKRIISYVQPKVSLKTGKVCGGEILCRWVDEQFKPLYFPDEFIPIFEETGFVKQVDFLMLENACGLLQTLQRRGFDDIVISVNLSKANFESENFVQKIIDTTSKFGVKNQSIEFEVTETAVMNSPAYVSDAIMQLRQLGYRVAMDDFGKEFSSLGSLSDNPFDTIKLDGIFFRNGLKTEKELNIAKNLITMLSKLDCEIVCEGVEDRETVNVIGNIYDDTVIQGYVFSKPIPLNQFEAFAATQYEFDFENGEIEEKEEKPQTINFATGKTKKKAKEIIEDDEEDEIEDKYDHDDLASQIAEMKQLLKEHKEEAMKKELAELREQMMALRGAEAPSKKTKKLSPEEEEIERLRKEIETLQSAAKETKAEELQIEAKEPEKEVKKPEAKEESKIEEEASKPIDDVDSSVEKTEEETKPEVVEEAQEEIVEIEEVETKEKEALESKEESVETETADVVEEVGTDTEAQDASNVAEAEVEEKTEEAPKTEEVEAVEKEIKEESTEESDDSSDDNDALKETKETND